MKTAIYNSLPINFNAMKQYLHKIQYILNKGLVVPFFIFLILLNFSAISQVLVDPNGDGGFETGTTWAANNWIVVGSATTTNNQWVINNGATGLTGNRCAYITNNTAVSPPPNTYTINAHRSGYFYRDISVPSTAISNSVILTFNWKGFGESTFDWIRVWAVPTSFTPIYATSDAHITPTGSAPTGRILLGTYDVQTDWQSAIINIPDAYIGQTFRLVYGWRNDNSVGTAPSAAVDNISLTYNSSIVVGKIIGNTTVACGGTTTLSSPTPSATNGTTTPSGNFSTTTFSTVGTTTLGSNFEGNVEVLVVAGGGGGGLRHAGGGGAGGVIYNPSFPISSNPSILVGAGGAGNTGSGATNGGNSTFGTITSTGGGFGSTNGGAASSGGSGGGGSNNIMGMLGTSSQGNSGGNQGCNTSNSVSRCGQSSGCTGCFAFGCGGGGAGSAAPNSATVGSIGGVGRTFNISGSNIQYGGGGGGGSSNTTSYAGGAGGGGAGGRSNSLNGINGTANTGGGGGGGGANGANFSGNGGNGGSGIVIVRYLLPTNGTWSSSNTAVATVNSSGVVTGITSGTATITYTGTNGSLSQATTTTITVNGASVAPTGIDASVNSTCIGSGDPVTLTSTGGTTGSDAEDVWYAGACANDAYTQEWATQPFSIANTTVNSVINGILTVTSSGANPNDPMIFMSGLGSFDPAVYRYINIRYRVTAGTAGGVEIFFYNTTHNFALGGETGYGTLISDGSWRTVSVDMWLDPDYLTGGNILGWRYDWATANGVTMDIDFITLSDRPIIGVGNAITVNPTSTTTYFTNKKGTCNTTTCFSKEIEVISCAPPACATNLSPTNAATGQPTNVQLSWDATPTALGYYVYFGTDNPPTALIATQAVTTYSPSILVANTTYYWQIIPANASGDATGCSVQSFTTFNPCASITTLTCGTPATATMTAGSGGGWNTTGNGQERMYTYTAPYTGNYRISVSAASGSAINYHFKTVGSCDNTGWNSIGSASGIGNVGSVSLTQGQQYYILLDAATAVTASQTFVVSCPPVVSSFTPTSACLDAGALVTISGQYFTAATGILFGAVGAPSFTVVDDNTITVTQPNGNASGTVTVGNAFGSGTSASSFTVYQFPTFNSQPLALTLCEGGNGSFSVGVPAGTYTYLWQYSATPANPASWLTTVGVTGLSGQQTNTLNISNVPFAYNAISVRCLITQNGCSTNSNNALLTVNATSNAGTVSGAAAICSGAQVVYTATPTTGSFVRFEESWTGSGYATVSTSNPYTWTSNNPNNTYYVRSVVKSGVCPEVFSNPATTFVNFPTPATPNINTAVVSGLPCIGNRNVTIDAVANATSYVWLLNNNMVSGESNATATINFPSASTYDVKVSASNSCGTSAPSGSLSVVIYPIETPSVSISSNVGLFPYNICDAVTTIDFTATPIGGGAPSANGNPPTYTWKLNGNTVGANSPNYSNTLPQNGDEITVVMQSGATCVSSSAPVTSNEITVICDMICEGSTGWAKFNPGTAGLTGSVDKYEVSIDGGTTWVNTYTPDVDGKIYINTTGGARSVKVRTARGDNASCESDKNTYTVWNIAAPDASGYALGDYIWTGRETTSWNSGGTNLPDSNWLVSTTNGFEIATVLPTLSNNVHIPAQDLVCVLNDAVVDITANTKDITIYTDATLTVNSINIMNVAGNWIGDGTFVAATGIVNLLGATNTTIKSGVATNKFYHINIDKTNDVNTVSLLDNLEATNKFDVTKGELVVPSNIVGKVKKFELKTGATKLNIQNQGELRVNE